MINKFRFVFKKYSFKKGILFILKYPFRFIKHFFYKYLIFKNDNIEYKFTNIYKNNYWGSSESKSGEGSNLDFTINIRSELPKLCKNYGIKVLFDAPCGDFNWMKHIINYMGINYIGADIVKEMVEMNKKNYNNNKINFLHLDITKDILPKADLMLCRDCLFHFSYYDIKSFLLNFLNSDIPYLLTTTYNDNCSNKDIFTGDFRRIDLFSSPFNFPKDTLTSIDESREGRSLHLWTKDQIKSIPFIN